MFAHLFYLLLTKLWDLWYIDLELRALYLSLQWQPKSKEWIVYTHMLGFLLNGSTKTILY